MARKYPMTVDEIVTSYRQARNRQTQIGVLADLNVCTRKEIRELLDAAEASGYGDAPLEVKGCRFAEMHLRVETLIGADVPGTLVELMATPAET